MPRRKAESPSLTCAVYARVSTTDQNCELQLRELREHCARRGWGIAGEYVERGWSGAKASRPELDRLMRDATRRMFGCVVVWKLDRFSRSMMQLHEQLTILRAHGIRFLATSQTIDTDENNPMSKLLLNILAVIAEFERELIRERVHAGLRSYRGLYRQGRIGKERSSRSGRNLPIGRSRRVFDRQKALAMRRRGCSIREIASSLAVGKGTVERLFAVSQNRG